MKYILVGHQVDVLNKTPDERIEKNYDIIVLDYFFGTISSENYIKQLGEIKDLSTPIIVVSGKVGEIPVQNIPRNLNAFILSKNFNFKNMLLYYIDLLSKKRGDEVIVDKIGDNFDYKTLFLNIVHDLRNDLGAVPAYLTMEKHGFENEEEKKEMQAIVHNAAIFAFSRIDYLSCFVKSECDRNITLMEAFQQVVDSKLIHENKNRIFLKGNIDKKIEFIPGYFLSVILKNLLENSCKFADESRELKIEIDYQIDEVDHIISINDNSVGMTSEKADSLFKKKLESNSGGLGMGLSILNRIISSFNGKILIYSRPGTGTSIMIRFPINNS